MSAPLLWIHNEALHPVWGGFEHDPKPAVALYIFDDARLRRDAWSRARIGFIYEALLELPVTILRGDPVSCLQDEMRRRSIERLVTVRPIAPVLLQIVSELRQSFAVELIERPTFLPEPVPELDLRRFSRYWRTARPLLLGQADEASSRVAGANPTAV